jgi:hypothetical protein
MWSLKTRGPSLSTLAIVAMTMLVAACASSASAPLDNAGKPVDQATNGSAPGAGNEPGASAGPTGDTLRVVYTGSLQLVVADLPVALAGARDKVSAAGGYIGASQESNDYNRPVAQVTYRIPSDHWDAVIADLRSLAAKVVAQQTQALEVGGKLVDLEARIRNLRASESALIAIAEKAGKVTDLLEVQAQLTEVRGQIEVLDAERARLADQVSYGTLVATFGLETVAVQETAKDWDPAKDVDQATATLIEVAQSLVRAGIWFVIVWLPLLLVLAIVVFVARKAARRWLPKRVPGTPAQPIEGWTDQR